MRYYVLPREGISDDMRAALTRGLGLEPYDFPTCERHCRRYGISEVSEFLDELGEAQAALATAQILGAPVRVDWRGRLCYDIAAALDDGSTDDDAKGWQGDQWIAALFDSAPTS